MDGVTDRLLVELAADGRVSVVPWPEGELLPGGAVGEASELVWPLDGDALEELRWYLEDYLRAPFGVYESRGPATAARLQRWGEAVFGAVFGSGPARDAYQRMRARTAGLQLVVRSGAAELLGLPWELMRDPAGGLPLALEVAGIDRSLPAGELDASFAVAGGRLRVLMVISRPAGAADVGFQMIARPLVHRLEAVRGNVDLVVLRPPTLDALVTALAEAEAEGEPFQVVHFDGHGVLAGRRLAGVGGAGMFQDTAAEGVLVFQAADGGPDRVPASRVAQVLGAARVPVVVLNACQSGAVGKELEAAVATRLLRGGAGSVVAMAYSVYAVAAAEFMAAFYERLFAGDTVSAAVTAGRRQLYRHGARPSPKGELPLADWMVPVHYLRREVSFPGLVTARPAGEPSLEEVLERLRHPEQAAARGVLAPVGVFTGRDALFFQLETAARQQHVIVLHGPAGTGKTELAKAFGRWWADTGGVERPGWVFWHSFEPGLASFGLAGVISEIGLAVFGAGFAQLDEDQRTGVVEEFLRERRALLIWDNFESVRSLPDPAAATPPLEEIGCDQLRGFLHRLATGARSTVLITSRTTETWLNDTSPASPGELRRITVNGLLPQEAAEYADELLAPYPAAAPRRASRTFGELMEWLDGHPLSMRLILPHLNTTDPKVLLEGLQGIGPLPGWDETQTGRAASLPASLHYSYAHLAPADQRLLTAVGLFHGVADADVLSLFSNVDGVPEQFADITPERWAAALDAAAEAGLLTALGASMYRLHPALPAYLTALWRTQEHTGYEIQRAAATWALLTAYAAFGDWLGQQIASGEAGLAYIIIGLQRTMGHLLGYALDHEHWAEAEHIARPLKEYWEARGLSAEADAWTDWVRAAVEDPTGAPAALDSAAGSLWLFVTTAQATRQLYSGQLAKGERTHREILAMLEAQPDSPHRQNNLAVRYHLIGSAALEQGRLDEAEGWYTRSAALNEELGNQSRLAMCYHQLGMVAQERGRLDEAEDWYTRSLAIKEELGDQPLLATSYHQLGIVAQLRGRLDEAEDWYTRSLAIKEELGDRPLLATSYHQLGIVAQLRGRLDEAEDWYTRSLAIKEELGDRPLLATSYYQLGRVAELRGRLDEAEGWYTRSLAIQEELGDRPRLAASYHQLGMVAQLRGRLDEAEGWYARAIAIAEDLGDRPRLALMYSQRGSLAEEQQDLARALEWAARCVALFEDVPHRGSGTAPGRLARLTRQLGMAALEASWMQVTGQPLPDTVRVFVSNYQPGSGGAEGEAGE